MDSSSELIEESPSAAVPHRSQAGGVTSTPFLPRKDIELNFDESVIAPDSYGGTLNCTVVPYKPKSNSQAATKRRPVIQYSSDEDGSSDDNNNDNSDDEEFKSGNDSDSVGIIRGTPSTNSDDANFMTAQFDKTVPARNQNDNTVPLRSPVQKPAKSASTVVIASSSSDDDSHSSGSSPNSINFLHRPGKARESRGVAATATIPKPVVKKNNNDEPIKKFEFKPPKNQAITQVASSSTSAVRRTMDGAVGGISSDDETTIPIDDLCSQVGKMGLQRNPDSVEKVGDLMRLIKLDQQQQQEKRTSPPSSPEVVDVYQPRRVIPPALKVKEEKQRKLIFLPEAPAHVPDLTYEFRASVGQGIQYLQKIISEVPNDDEPDELEVPKGLITELYDHQKYGLKWMWWREHQVPYGGILADEMGLGKTIMVLALICRGKSEEKENSAPAWNSVEKGRLVPSKATLVVCPPSVMGQWEDEIKKKTRGLKVLLYHGPSRPKSAPIISVYDIVLTSYNTLGSDIPKLTEQSEAACRSPLVKIHWERIVLDEGHIIRNPKTLGAQAACRLKAHHRWVVTGTPVHNSPSDMFSLTKFLELKPFNEKKVWEMWIGMKLVANQNAERLNTISRALLLRRTKDEVMCGLKKQGQAIPKKTIVDINVELKPEEREIYDHLEAFAEKEFKYFLKNREKRNADLQAAANHFMAGKQKVKSSQEKSFSHVFVLILRLRQCSVLPYLIRTMIDDDENDVDEDEYDPIEDLISLKNPTFDTDFKSSKLERLYKDLRSLRRRCQEAGTRMEKAVVVSQWSSLLKVVEGHLKEYNFSCVTISGDVKISDRMDIMTKFNGNPKRPEIMLLSLQAGGVGLNLTGANHLFFLDIHWNPQLELQAQDRIHRFGQTKPVTIYRYISSNTMEARVMELQAEKLALADGILNGAGKKDGGGLKIDEMKRLFGL